MKKHIVSLLMVLLFVGSANAQLFGTKKNVLSVRTINTDSMLFDTSAAMIVSSTVISFSLTVRSDSVDGTMPGPPIGTGDHWPGFHVYIQSNIRSQVDSPWADVSFSAGDVKTSVLDTIILGGSPINIKLSNLPPAKAYRVITALDSLPSDDVEYITDYNLTYE